MVGQSTGGGLIVYASGAKFGTDGMMQQGSNTINASQGGGNTNIGVNNQMFDKGEGCRGPATLQPASLSRGSEGAWLAGICSPGLSCRPT
jgi:hypothetical protein